MPAANSEIVPGSGTSAPLKLKEPPKTAPAGFCAKLTPPNAPFCTVIAIVLTPECRNEDKSNVAKLAFWTAKATLVVLPTVPTWAPFTTMDAKSSAEIMIDPPVGAPFSKKFLVNVKLINSAGVVAPVTPGPQIQVAPGIAARFVPHPAPAKPYRVAPAGQVLGAVLLRQTAWANPTSTFELLLAAQDVSDPKPIVVAGATLASTRKITTVSMN